jgi:hypothetical protein
MEPRGTVIKGCILILELEGTGGNHQKTVETKRKRNSDLSSFA